MKKKRTKGETRRVHEKSCARRSRGGGGVTATDKGRAATKQKRRSGAAVKSSRPVNGKAGETDGDTAHRPASQKQNGRAIKEPKPTNRLRVRETNGRANGLVNPKEPMPGQAAGEGEVKRDADELTAETCRTLQSLQRRRAAAIKSRVAIDNQLAAVVATELGYFAGMSEEDRKARRKQAEELIKAIDSGCEVSLELKAVQESVAGIVANTRIARAGFDAYIKALEKEMTAAAKALPVAELAEGIRGFGLLRLAVIVGEVGNFSDYAGPAKVWKRMGCAPFQGKMPSTWRRGKEGKLSADEWSEIGYSPRRRAIMFVVSDLLVKLNFESAGERRSETDSAPAADDSKRTPGAYRAHYDAVKAKAKEAHPDWPDCRVNYHGHLLCAKRLLKDLWIAWRKASPVS